MDEVEFKRRTKQLASEAIRLTEELPRSTTGSVLGRQLLRCVTSIGANYRASCRGRSIAEIVAKLSIVEEEADEALYWLELLQESRMVPPQQVAWLLDETNQVLAMTVASKRTLKVRLGDKGFGGRNRES